MLKIYSIRDNCAQAMHKPFFLPNDGTAIRSCMDALKDPEIAAHTEDYSLYCLGEFDEKIGKIDALDTKVHIIDFVDLQPKGE